MMLPDKQFLLLLLFIARLLFTNFLNFQNFNASYWQSTKKFHLYVNNQFFNDNCDVL